MVGGGGNCFFESVDSHGFKGANLSQISEHVTSRRLIAKKVASELRTTKSRPHLNNNSMTSTEYHLGNKTQNMDSESGVRAYKIISCFQCDSVPCLRR